MALDFPASPVQDQQYTDPSNSTTYTWDGQSWTVAAVSPGTVTTVLGTSPIVSDESITTPTISINQAGINLASCNNNAGFITSGDVPAQSVTSVNTKTGNVILDAADVAALPDSGGTLSGALTISSGVLTLPAGTAALPSLVWTDTDSGIYQPSTNHIAISTNTVRRVLITDTGLSVTGTIESSGALTCTQLNVGAIVATGDLGVNDITCDQVNVDEIINLTNFANLAAAPAGQLGSVASIGGALCYHDGTSYKTVTLGEAPA